MDITGTCLTRQIYFLFALLLTAAGCGGGRHDPAAPTDPTSTSSSQGAAGGASYDLTLHWSFERHVLDRTEPVVYGCSQAGVDEIVVSYADGRVLDSTPCVHQGVQGASFPVFVPGTYDLIVRGYRSGLRDDVALYEARITATISPDGPSVVALDASLPGIPNDLDIYASFVAPDDIRSQCAYPEDMLSYKLVDFAQTVVASGTIPCADPAGISFTDSEALDRDTYSVQMQEFNGNGVLYDSDGCAFQTFDHLGSDTGEYGWQVSLYPANACP